MIEKKRRCAAFAVCGSFCTLETALEQAQELTARGWELLPVMSNTAARYDTRFGRAGSWRQRLEALTGHPVLDSLQAVEPLGPKNMAEALVIAPCTGSTLARLAAGLSDTPVTLAAKSLLRVGRPVVIAVSTNDGLGASGENIARLYQRKHYYFVPYGQDDPQAKPQSLKARFALLPAALDAALDAARALRGQGWELLPVMSFAAGQDTRFGRASGWRHQLEGLTGRPVLDTLQAVEPLGPRHLADALVIAPCTGATLARLAEGLSDTPVTLAAKSLLRVGCPVVIAVSTNDGLGASGENIARLYQRKHYYFVPYGQDDPNTKPQSLKARFELLPQTLEAALEGRQLQPVLQCPCG